MGSYRRRGFRLPNNTLLLLLFFFTIGLFLHYRGKTQPVVAFWENLKSVFTGSPVPTAENPYKAPEPNSDTLAVDSRSSTGSKTSTRKPQKPLPDFEENRPANLEPTSNRELQALIDEAEFFLPAIGSNDQIVRRVGYTLKYAEKYEQPAWVAYPIGREQISGTEVRENDFMPDPAVRTGTAVSSDYLRSGYDRGHMAPAADFKNSYQVMKETFYMSNICPQVPQFNRGIWLELEKMVRVWAYKYERIFVVTGPVLTPGLPTIGGVHQVAVPRQFYKVILYAQAPNLKGIAFLMQNQGSSAPLSTYVVPIDSIEKLTGIDFFPSLPDDIERRVEANINSKEWYRLK